MYMDILFPYMKVHHVCKLPSESRKGGFGSPETVVTEVSELPWAC